MRRRRAWLLAQLSCVCFVVTLFLALAACIAVSIAQGRVPFRVSRHCLWLLAVLPVLGVGLAFVSLRGMRRHRMHSADARLAALALALNILMVAAMVVLILGPPHLRRWLES